ncbi:hypothetical protein [Acidihalobacter prosperus]|uniref:hypothetical protein n=1 Tax=Acidihalobacter prosperus TaxID=160660 RepID=UPI0007EE4166|nr:hypothetical protein [Acidihalobacter prosperus]
MASIKSTLRWVFVSPEMLIIAVAAYLIINTPDSIRRISSAFAAGPDAVKYLALLPAAIFGWSITEAKSILLPAEDTKALLQNWPRYPDLKGRVAIGLCFQLLFALAAFSVWVYSPKFDDPKSFVVAVLSVAGSLISGSTFLMASIAVRGTTKRGST